eukprot:m.19035 g.19035  ORF g.19035 m.19035 type:complete len:1041 (+) comp27772_c0_seq3:137-3259(+)
MALKQDCWTCLYDFVPDFKDENGLEDLIDILFARKTINADDFDMIDESEDQWKELVQKILPTKSEKAFSEFMEAVKEVDREVYARLESQDQSTALMTNAETIVLDEDLIRRVISIDDLGTCFDLANELGALKGKREPETLTDLKDVLLDYVKKKSDSNFTAIEPISITEALVQDFHKRKEDFLKITDSVKNFFSAQKEVMENLQLPSTEYWMNPDRFEEIKKGCGKGKPTLLVAGTTSSGKSTLLNALLGDDILPTSHNAATSAICEICYSPDGKKFAEVEWKEEDRRRTERLDLTDESGREAFRKAVNRHRSLMSTASTVCVYGPQEVCESAKIYWPFEFLKFFSLVDSPGVTEESGESVSRQVTEDFQKRLASGFIYVLDSSRAGEEAGEAGGLLANIADTFPIPGAALFVLNKWDFLLNETPEETERRKYIKIVERRLSENWRGFTSDQLIRMNSLIAYKAGNMGVSSDDMKRLSDEIRKIVRKGLHFQLIKNLKDIHVLVDQTQRCLSDLVREVKMPDDEKTQHLKAQKGRIEELRDSLASGKVAKTRNELETKMADFLGAITEDLRSEKNQRVLFARESKTIHNLLSKGISISQAFQDFVKWINKDIKQSVDEILLSDFKDNRGQALPILSRWLSPAERIKNEGNAATSKGTSWFGRIKVKLKRVFGLSLKQSEFKKVIQNLRENDGEDLRHIVLEIVKETCRPAMMLYKEIPDQVNELEATRSRKWKEDEKHLVTYEAALKKCESIQKEVAEFTLRLDMHEYEYKDLDFPKTGEESSEIVLTSKMKVKLHALQGDALMEVEEVFSSVANDLVKFSEISRLLNHEHIVKYYGSVWLSDIWPGTVGLLFEYFPFTLADKIFNRSQLRTSVARDQEWEKEIIQKILGGLCFLHDTVKLVHRRIVPENIMLSANGNEVKIGGMKISEMPRPDDFLLYAAPEILTREIFSESSDMYSFGTLMWAVWNRRQPHRKYAGSYTMFINRITDGCIADIIADLDDLHDAGQLQAKWYDLMKACWLLNPSKRITASEAKKTVDLF